ncbi:MAG: acyl-CoA thioesterase [Phycisphaerae bacterium]|jgi:YbgC/YbaW family acyl-CoA thioester hydrolase
MACEFKLRRQVEFAETDMAGIMHFANYFRFMEEAEHAFFRSLGLSIHMKTDEGLVTWPRVHAECDYLLPLRFEDDVEVHLRVQERKPKAIHFHFVFRRLNASPPEEVARGRVITVCVTYDPAAGRMSAIEIPPAVAALIEPAPQAGFAPAQEAR